MATGWTAPPISKLPFLNIITEVLLMQVPVEKFRVPGHKILSRSLFL